MIEEYSIDYIKWDHNRYLVEVGHQPDLRPGAHNQTAAVYRMMAELKRRYPTLEIESCAGGGGRIDLGIVEYADRVWASDSLDAHDRQDIQRWTCLLLPPELVGTHIGSFIAHTTLRHLALSYRAGTAIWGHLGIEWDLTRATADERGALAEWVALYKNIRALLHTGDLVHADIPGNELRVDGVVAADRSDALYEIAAVGRPVSWPPGRVPLVGLDADDTYLVRGQPPGDTYPGFAQPPQWMDHGVYLPGRVLAEIGIDAPRIHPDHLILVRATRQ